MKEAILAGAVSSKKRPARRSFYDYLYGSRDDEDGQARLSRRRPLKFISDSETNTILVQGAEPEQIRIIKELIAIYDSPEVTVHGGSGSREGEAWFLKLATIES